MSSVSHVLEITTPTLVLRTERDYRTPANTAELFYLGLQNHGVDTRLVRYPRSGEPAHAVDRLERIVRWFDDYSDHRDVPPSSASRRRISPAARTIRTDLEGGYSSGGDATPQWRPRRSVSRGNERVLRLDAVHVQGVQVRDWRCGVEAWSETSAGSTVSSGSSPVSRCS